MGKLRPSTRGNNIVALDFDGTLFEHDPAFPKVGEARVDVIEKALEVQRKGCTLILWTCRSTGEELVHAVEAAQEYGLVFDYINSGFYIEPSRKIYATLYVDDRAPGSIEYFVSGEFEKDMGI